MSELRKTIHLREVAIAIVVALSLFITGLVLDFNITSKVYDPINTSWFGIILAGIGELPVVIGLIFGGYGLIYSRAKRPVWVQVIMIILGVGFILAGVYFTFDTIKDWWSFKNTEDHKTLLLIFGILSTILIDGVIIFLSIFLTRKVDKNVYFRVAVTILGTILIAVVLSNFLKYLWGRERPRVIFTKENPYDFFNPVWDLHPLRAIIQKFTTGETSNNYKSFPSGHTVYASTGMLIFPLMSLLSPKTKNLRALQIPLFYVGLGWAFMVAISRIYAGAHFMSDTAAGMLVTITSGIIGMLVASKILKEKEVIKN